MTSDTLVELLERDSNSPESGAENHDPSEAAVSLVVSCPLAQQPSNPLWPCESFESVANVGLIGSQLRESVEGKRALAPDAHFVRTHEISSSTTATTAGYVHDDTGVDGRSPESPLSRQLERGTDCPTAPVAYSGRT